MQVEGLTLALRPRRMAEAADLGVRLVQTHAASVWRCFGPLLALVYATAVAVWVLTPLPAWSVALMLWWAKPWLDRSLLFVLSRAVFGQSTRWADLWAARREVWFTGLLRALTLDRLSPWRSFTQPVQQLERQRGAALRRRKRLLLRGQQFGAACMLSAFSTTEQILAAALEMLVSWFTNRADQFNLFTAVMGGDSSASAELLASAFYICTVLLVEPFFVGAGFASYLNRRVELEAWDIEQEFRLVFAAR